MSLSSVARFIVARVKRVRFAARRYLYSAVYAMVRCLLILLLPVCSSHAGVLYRNGRNVIMQTTLQW